MGYVRPSAPPAPAAPAVARRPQRRRASEEIAGADFKKKLRPAPSSRACPRRLRHNIRGLRRVLARRLQSEGGAAREGNEGESAAGKAPGRRVGRGRGGGREAAGGRAGEDGGGSSPANCCSCSCPWLRRVEVCLRQPHSPSSRGRCRRAATRRMAAIGGAHLVSSGLRPRSAPGGGRPAARAWGVPARRASRGAAAAAADAARPAPPSPPQVAEIRRLLGEGRTGGGRTGSGGIEKIEKLVEELEQAQAGEATTYSPLLPGRWRLLTTYKARSSSSSVFLTQKYFLLLVAQPTRAGRPPLVVVESGADRRAAWSTFNCASCSCTCRCGPCTPRGAA